MRFIEKTQLLERVDQLIRMKATGNSRELAKRLKISKSTVYEIIDLMKTMGAEIDYCNKRSSYYYTTEKVLAIGFVDPIMINGGKKLELSLNCPVFSDKYVFS